MKRALVIKRLRLLERSKQPIVARLAKDAADLLERESDFEQFRKPDDPDGILPQIIAARCLGIEYGDPGPKLPPEYCRRCWGDRHVWLGNVWGLQHTGGTMRGCNCPCHADEVWMASAGDSSAMPARH